MRIKYLENCNNKVFDVIARKTDKGIQYNYILINPLYRYINNKEDSQFLINSMTSYSELLESFEIKESSDSNLLLNQDYFTFGVIESDEGYIQFVYSEDFTLHSEDLKNIQNRSIDLANVLLSVLNANEENINKYLEEEMTEMLTYNYNPIKEGVAEVFGIVLLPNDEGDFSLAVKYYSDSNHEEVANKEIIINMFDELVPIIMDAFKNYNFFMVKEPVTIIKLGISTDANYLVDSNSVLLKNLDGEKENKVKNILIKTYECL